MVETKTSRKTLIAKNYKYPNYKVVLRFTLTEAQSYTLYAKTQITTCRHRSLVSDANVARPILLLGTVGCVPNGRGSECWSNFSALTWVAPSISSIPGDKLLDTPQTFLGESKLRHVTRAGLLNRLLTRVRDIHRHSARRQSQLRTLYCISWSGSIRHSGAPSDAPASRCHSSTTTKTSR